LNNVNWFYPCGTNAILPGAPIFRKFYFQISRSQGTACCNAG
jgi:hypothetical protein